MKKNRASKIIHVGVILAIIGLAFGIKNLSLIWVENYDTYSEVTINFLFPMQQDALENYIGFESNIEKNQQFEYHFEWLSSQIVRIRVKEKNAIKGQNIRLCIKKLPTASGAFLKSAKVSIQFKAPIQLIEPQKVLKISSMGSFYVRFNTPMDLREVKHYLGCDATFLVWQQDAVTFKLTPKKSLENGRKYVLCFKKGMRSKGGGLLEYPLTFVVEVDQKPVIAKTYPREQDRWIGLYPRISLESQMPICEAYMTIDGQRLRGKLRDNHHAYFLLERLLKPQTAYEVVFQTMTSTGEKSEKKRVHFETTGLEETKIWLDIRTGHNPHIDCYRGNQKIKTLACAVGKGQYSLYKGTYYIQDKKAAYEGKNEGANFYFPLYEGCGIQGMMRDQNWLIKTEAQSALNSYYLHPNIILKDEDASWLYEYATYDTMVIIRN